MSIGDYSKPTYGNVGDGSPTPLSKTTFQPVVDKLEEIDSGLADSTVIKLEANRKYLQLNSLIFGI